MTNYKVYLTPRTASTTYGTEIEITDLVLMDGVSLVKRTLDSADYDFGVFTYGVIDLKASNENGYFNDESDSRSIFKFSRDLAKVRVEFNNDDGTTITFRGLINEEATRLDPVSDLVRFKVLSLDSVIRNTRVGAGSITNGSTCKSAMTTILDIAAIASVLNISAGNINPALNFTIDDGSKLENKSTRDVLNLLLLASNSVMVIDSSNNVIIKSRDIDEDAQILNLYGPYDIHRRENIIDLRDYNAGRHRMFTAIKVNDFEARNDIHISTYGYRQKAIELEFITNATTEETIAETLLDEFKSPKIECVVEVPAYVAAGKNLLDTVSLNFPLRIKPIEGKFLPVIGVSKIASTDEPLPYVFGSVEIPANLSFKIIEIVEDVRNFKAALKLRQTGTETNDGIFNGVGNAIVGFAIVGEAIIRTGTTDTWNPSVTGAALMGSTKIA